MTTENSKLEPIDPSTATELWLDEKGTSCADSTVRNYRFRLDHFLRWCESEGIDNLNVLTGRSIQKFRLWRKEDGELNALSMRMQMSAIRVFLKWAGSIEAVDQNLYDKVRVPRVDPEDQQRDEILHADTAQAILDYLSKYEWASTEHALFAVLWQTGIRIGTAHAIDLADVDLDEEYIRVNHRPDKGTALKNGAKGERLIAITQGLASVLEDYIETNRHDVTDDNGRDALFTTTKGRMTRNTIRRKIYLVTPPCYRSVECPGCKGVGGDQKCPEAVSPHSIRRGSITHYLSEDVPVEVVGDRMNVSRKVLDKHYDKRSEEVKVEQRRGYLDNI